LLFSSAAKVKKRAITSTNIIEIQAVDSSGKEIIERGVEATVESDINLKQAMNSAGDEGGGIYVLAFPAKMLDATKLSGCRRILPIERFRDICCASD